MFERTGQTAMMWRGAVFVGMVLLIGACVQIAGIDDPHPKTAGEDAGQDANQGTDEDAGQDAGQDADQDAGPLDLEWANWPMPNPPDAGDAGLPNPATYTIDTGKGLVLDTITNLTWQRNVSASSVTWEVAKNYCNGLDYGGYTSGWRLPTAIELVSLVDFTKANPVPTIDDVAFPNTPADWFWTATPLVSDPNSVWMVSFNTSKTSYTAKTDEFRVRCVR